MRISDWSSDVCSSDLLFECARSRQAFANKGANVLAQGCIGDAGALDHGAGHDLCKGRFDQVLVICNRAQWHGHCESSEVLQAAGRAIQARAGREDVQTRIVVKHLGMQRRGQVRGQASTENANTTEYLWR